VGGKQQILTLAQLTSKRGRKQHIQDGDVESDGVQCIHKCKYVGQNLTTGTAACEANLSTRITHKHVHNEIKRKNSKH
jgi:hypothetical protein